MSKSLCASSPGVLKWMSSFLYAKCQSQARPSCRGHSQTTWTWQEEGSLINVHKPLPFLVKSSRKEEGWSEVLQNPSTLFMDGPCGWCSTSLFSSLLSPFLCYIRECLGTRKFCFLPKYFAHRPGVKILRRGPEGDKLS